MDIVILVLHLLVVVVGAAVEAIVEAAAIADLVPLHPGGTAVQRAPVTAGARAEALHHQREGNAAPPPMVAEALALGPRRNVRKLSERGLITARAQGERAAKAPRVQEGRDPQPVIGIEAQRLMGGALALETMVMALMMALREAVNRRGTKKLGSCA